MPGDHPALQRAIDMNGSARDDLGAGGDTADDGDIAVRMHDRLAGADIAVDDQRSPFALCSRSRRAVGSRGAAGSSRAGRRIHRAAAGHDRGKMRPDQRGAAFSTPITLMWRRASWLRNSRYSLTRLDPRHFEDDWLRGKERRRTGEPAVERREPIVERLGGLENEGQKRASPKIQGLSGGSHARSSGGPVGVSLTMVGRMVYERLRAPLSHAVCRWK